MVKFLESKDNMELSFMAPRHVEMSLRESAQEFIVFASLRGEAGEGL